MAQIALVGDVSAMKLGSPQYGIWKPLPGSLKSAPVALAWDRICRPRETVICPEHAWLHRDLFSGNVMPQEDVEAFRNLEHF